LARPSDSNDSCINPLSWWEEAPSSRQGPVAGTTPDLEFAEKVLTQPVQASQFKMNPEIGA